VCRSGEVPKKNKNLLKAYPEKGTILLQWCVESLGGQGTYERGKTRKVGQFPKVKDLFISRREEGGNGEKWCTVYEKGDHSAVKHRKLLGGGAQNQVEGFRLHRKKRRNKCPQQVGLRRRRRRLT